MKNNLIAIGLFCLLLIACGDDANNDGLFGGSDEHFTCMVDNEAFRASDTGAFAKKDQDGPETTRVFGTPDLADSEEKLVSIKVDDNLETNVEYPLDKDHFWVSLNFGENQYSSLPIIGGSGVITITNRTSDMISGEFSCTLGNVNSSGEMITITDGSFSVLYQ